MRALGLNTSDPHHEGFYRAMRVSSPRPIAELQTKAIQDEAIAVYNRLQTDRTSLVEPQRQDQSVQPPFFWHHIQPERRRLAIIDTWQQARPGTTQRQLFDRGATNGEHGPNWVTLWLLYSVFRSRDVRNNRNRRVDQGGSGSGSSGEFHPSSSQQCGTDHLAGHGGSNGETKVYDPARNAYRPR